ncbi:hydroquinone glucosyltransferase-like [Abrus precatorius]|uniref:Glycosyltransferase n=1 Tax=Abrus precatorius TaxID=3816 RepID=A0A8B8JU12_ABRPR|nr:hydroquinone glucosyltransferase-like [Abrus precatorius]
MGERTCIAMVPSPGLSHLIPLVEFAKRLVLQHHNLNVTFLIPTLGSPTPSTLAILNSLPPNIDFTILPQPQVNMQDLPENKQPATRMKLIVKHSIPFLCEALKSLASHTHLVALVYSVFSTDAHHVAKQFNLLSYVFYASGAVSLSFCLSLPKLDETTSNEFFLDSTNTVNVPGCVKPFKVKDLPQPVFCERSSETYKSYFDVCQTLSLVDGVIVNTFTDLEPNVIRALQEREGPCVYPVGPIIQTKSSNEVNGSMCMTWLDNQPPTCVLYVSFGSGGTLSYDQFIELAFGLELSGHKFLWVVRGPNDYPASAYFIGEKEEDPLTYLPNGFLDRTKGQGLVVPSWAPQIEVLSHGSIGGFLSHCGWSSTLESVVNGVPMIAWPLFAEQKMNAIILNDELKVALRPMVDESGIVKREEIAKIIKRVMEGKEGLEMRKRMNEFSDAAAFALGEHGSSMRALSSLTTEITKHLNGI